MPRGIGRPDDRFQGGNLIRRPALDVSLLDLAISLDSGAFQRSTATKWASVGYDRRQHFRRTLISATGYSCETSQPRGINDV